MLRFRMLPPLVAALTAFIALPALADSREATYEVTITNLTKGQTFTPILVATHSSHVRLFEVGESASRELEILAEDGDTGPQTEALKDLGRRVRDVETIPGLLGPGESASMKVRAGRHTRHLSAAAMLIPTNDTFVALNAVPLPFYGTRTHDVPAYDAGTEENDQNCENIPGPRCGGDGFSPGPNDGDEGFVGIGNGFHELGRGDPETGEVLGPLPYDWRNPVARIQVRRVR